MNRIAEQIRERVTTREAVEFYGFDVTRSGCIKCPFHAGDNQASLHIYPGKGGFCCFGCGAKGSVIDFVMLLFDCGFSTACERINADFSLCLPFGKKTTYREKKSRMSAIMRVKEHDKKLEEANIKCERLEMEWALADAIKRNFHPQSIETVSWLYAWAARNIDQIKYELSEENERRWEIEQSARNPGVDESKLPNA